MDKQKVESDENLARINKGTNSVDYSNGCGFVMQRSYCFALAYFSESLKVARSNTHINALFIGVAKTARREKNQQERQRKPLELPKSGSGLWKITVALIHTTLDFLTPVPLLSNAITGKTEETSGVVCLPLSYYTTIVTL
jgi:hypothetical protein